MLLLEHVVGLGTVDLSRLSFDISRNGLTINVVIGFVRPLTASLSYRLPPCFILSYIFLDCSLRFRCRCTPRKSNIQADPARFPGRFCMGIIGGNALYTSMFAPPRPSSRLGLGNVARANSYFFEHKAAREMQMQSLPHANNVHIFEQRCDLNRC
jgi:hypothetical protein